jgi:predicted DNA-binding protein with PD1-like motif
MDGPLVYTTAEIVVAERMQLQFSREPDATTTYRELSIRER